MKKENIFLSEDDNVVEFKKPELKTDWATPEDDWLGRLKQGTVFLTRNKPEKLGQQSIDLSQYHVLVARTPGGAVRLELLIADKEGEMRAIPVWVDSMRFSQTMIKFEILRTNDD